MEALAPLHGVLVLVQAQISSEVKGRFMCKGSFEIVGGMRRGGTQIRELIFIKFHCKSDGQWFQSS